MFLKNIDFNEDLRIIFVLGMAQKLILEDLLEEQPGITAVILHSIPIQTNEKYVFLNIKPNTIFGWIRCFISVRFLIFKLKSKKNSFHLYTPHPVNFISNYFYNRLKPKKISYLYDGTLNFASPRWDSELFRGYIKKQKIKSLLFFILYEKLRNHEIIGQEKLADELIVPNGLPVNRLKFPRLIRGLNFSSVVNIEENFLVDKGGENYLLFLEPLDLSPVIFEKMSCIIRKMSIQYKIDKIIIKMHPSKKKSSIDTFFLQKLGLELIYISRSISAEDVYKKYAPSCVVSTNSSALLNIKCFYPSARVFAIDESFSSKEFVELKSLFLECGIEVL